MSVRTSTQSPSNLAASGPGSTSKRATDAPKSAPKSTIHGSTNPGSSLASTGPARAATELPVDPFAMTPYAQALVTRRVLLAPVVVTWQYKVASHKRFTGWLGTREILMCESRLGIDADLRDVRYGGTYRVSGVDSTDHGAMDNGGMDQGGMYRTVWGYTTEAAMHTLQRLASEPTEPTTIVQRDLMEFISTIKRFVAEAGDVHFSQDVMLAGAATTG
jgi:hypothetical protein